MGRLSDAPDSRQRVEYGWSRVFLRLFFASFAVVTMTLINYGGDEFSFHVVCSGGLSEAMKFASAFLASIALIEAMNWTLWYASHEEFLAVQEQADRFEVPHAQQSINTDETTEGAPPDPEYTLVTNGGRLILAPSGPVLGLFFAMMAGLTAGVIGLPDACVGPKFAVVSWTRYLVSAFALLALISFGENRVFDEESRHWATKCTTASGVGWARAVARCARRRGTFASRWRATWDRRR